MSERFLTQAEKERTLVRWEDLKSDPLPPWDTAGRGLPDPEIFPLCDALNALDGVCTLQSCAGHPAHRDRGVLPGHLWLRLSESLAALFQKRAFELSTRSDLIERVVTIYTQDGREIVSIEFRGNESGRLEASSSFIAAFFERLRAEEKISADLKAAQAIAATISFDEMLERLPAIDDPELAAVVREAVQFLSGRRANSDKEWLGTLERRWLFSRTDSDDVIVNAGKLRRLFAMAREGTEAGRDEVGIAALRAALERIHNKLHACNRNPIPRRLRTECCAIAAIALGWR